MINRLTDKVPIPSEQYKQQAWQRQAQLTKPAGSLGILEETAVRLAALQQTSTPTLERLWVSVFAADHGVVESGVSAFPQSVTTAMVHNFIQGGAAVNVLSKRLCAHFEVVDAGLVEKLEVGGLIIDRAGAGTANFVKQPAMNDGQLAIALNAGKHAVERALAKQSQLFIGGEMGIGNTTSASALASVLLQLPASCLTGAGTGLDKQGVEYKSKVIEQAITLHKAKLMTPVAILQYLGGFEIAALLGAYLYAAQNALPVLIDGFISSVAALLAVKINPACQSWFLYSHKSQEQGHQRVLDALNARPMLDLHMRLGEASGALVAVPLLQAACDLHNQMATFEQAQIMNNNNSA